MPTTAQRGAYDAIVLGTGGVGSAALYELARRGRRVLGLDRFPPGHDRGSSHGQSRLIRRAYFEHPDYVPLVLDAFSRWHDLEATIGRPLLRSVGLLQIGPSEGSVHVGVRRSAEAHDLRIEALSGDDVAGRWPMFHVPRGLTGLYEQGVGVLFVEECVRAHVELATVRGAELHTDVEVLGWSPRGDGVVVDTSRGRYKAARLIVTAGPWAGAILADLGLPLVVRRKPQYWFAPASERAFSDAGELPAFLYELPEGVFYGFPRLDEQGLKVAEHSGGAVVADPLRVSREVEVDDLARVEQFIGKCLPALTTRLLRHSVCMYTMSPDEHFIVDAHPECRQVVFAAGLSGHGFKFAPVLGAALADLACDGHSRQPIDFLSLQRPGLARRGEELRDG